MTQAEKTTTEVMRAVEYDRYGSPNESGLQIRTVPRPQAAPGEVLVRIHASSVNPLDTTLRSGALRFLTGNHFPKRIGLDFAGEVVESKAPDIKVGDRVWGEMPLLAKRGFVQGSAADFVTISTTRVSPSPKSLNFIEAASMASVGSVAIITLQDKARLQPGERLLVRGAAGGVGCMAVQLGKQLGAHVTALASAKDLAFLKELGAAEALDYRTTTPSSLEPFDVVLDLVGTDLSKYRRLLSRRGRMFCMAMSSKSITYILASNVFGPRRVQFFSATPMKNTLTALATYVDDGSIRPVIHSTYNLDNIAEAHLSLEAGGGRGKRVIKHIDN